ncbi:MAG: hypothetical protein M1812_001108 [Candelaria pacifica]|nr:MAG: hypothetical protein M1812_001108 [Candelaria pacifica]
MASLLIPSLPTLTSAKPEKLTLLTLPPEVRLNIFSFLLPRIIRLYEPVNQNRNKKLTVTNKYYRGPSPVLSILLSHPNLSSEFAEELYKTCMFSFSRPSSCDDKTSARSQCANAVAFLNMIGNHYARLVRHLELDFVYDERWIPPLGIPQMWLDIDVIASFMKQVIAMSYEGILPFLTVSCTHDTEYHYNDEHYYHFVYNFLAPNKCSYTLELAIESVNTARLLRDWTPLLLSHF